MYVSAHKRCRRTLSYLILLLFFTQSVYAQQKDSLRIYKKLRKMAYRNKYSALAYDAIFVDPEPKEYPRDPTSTEEKNVNPYLKYSGRIIREVHVIVYDPFGHSVTDTVPRRVNRVQRAGNNLHIRTRKFIIHNKLLFKRHTPVKALELSESERLLREAVYVNDAKILIRPVNKGDSVDVYVLVHDKWPVTIPLDVSDIYATARFRNNNLFGLGQQFQQSAGFTRPDRFDFSGYYNIANLDNTYISSALSYNTSRDGTSVNLVFDRPFYSPLAKWAGGIQVSKNWNFYDYADPQSESRVRVPLDNMYYDGWVGKNFKITHDSSLFTQSANLATGIRYYRADYQRRPPFSIEPNIRNYQAFVGNVGFSIQQFYKDKYIYRFGANEDVPEGFMVQLIYGGLKRELTKIRYYLGAEIGRAKHFNFGYLSTTFAYGVFFNRQVNNDLTINYRINYFSDLKRLGRWYFRQFFNYNLVHGENKLAGETLTLSNSELYGFNPGSILYGNTKMVFNSETVAYMPYNIIGFRLAPVLMAGMGVVGDRYQPLYQSRLYQGYSLGVMIRNENLLSSTFQFSYGIYPFFPDGRNNVWIYNPVTSFTLKVRGFYAPRPEFVAYN